MKLPVRIRTKERSLKYPLTVGSCAAVIGVAPATLRVYEREGIVKPDRDSDGRRLYLPDDVKRLQAHRAALGKA